MVALGIVLVGCSGSDSTDGVSGGAIASPCDLADAALVSQFFIGTVADGVEGSARNCSFAITGGEVGSVDVYYFGEASGWDGTKSGFEANRGGVTDVDGIGDAAYYPNDRGPRELVVQSGGEIFAVTVFTGPGETSDAVNASVAGLAGAIADDLG